MKFREAQKEDFEYLKDNSISRGIHKYSPEQIDYIYTLEHKGKPLGIGGFRFINRTTAWCWLDLSKDAKNHIIRVYRVIDDWIEIFAQDHKLKRLQAYVECDFDKAIRMVEHLGFKKESIMENFMGNKNAYMYVRLI